MKTFGLGTMTLGGLFKRPETRLYPLETPDAPAGFRGRVTIKVEDCIFCGLCAKACPADALTVDRAARIWTIDRFACVQCADCTLCCPKGCLDMDRLRPQVAPAPATEAAHGAPLE